MIQAMTALVQSRRLVLQGLVAAPLAGLAACVSSPDAVRNILGGARPLISQAVSAALAPTGKLRASINLGNPILANKGPDGTAVGVSVDLAARLAELLGVSVEYRVVEAAARSVDAVKIGQADIGFFAIDPLRSNGIGFSAAYVQIEGAYLVRQDSALTDNAQVDRPGTRIMVGKGSAYDLYLSRELKNAKLMHTPTSPQVVEQFLAQGADVAAGVKQQLEADAERLGGVRLLPGRFMVIDQAMGVQAGRGGAAEQALRDFVEWAKASGFVAQALARHNIRGAVVAPAANPKG
jgi:polar amino acid transport system substrate-binding protein